MRNPSERNNLAFYLVEFIGNPQSLKSLSRVGYIDSNTAKVSGMRQGYLNLFSEKHIG